VDPRDVFFLENLKLKKENKFKVDSGELLTDSQFQLYYKHLKEKPKLVEELFKKIPASVKFEN